MKKYSKIARVQMINELYGTKTSIEYGLKNYCPLKGNPCEHVGHVVTHEVCVFDEVVSIPNCSRYDDCVVSVYNAQKGDRGEGK